MTTPRDDENRRSTDPGGERDLWARFEQLEEWVKVKFDELVDRIESSLASRIAHEVAAEIDRRQTPDQVARLEVEEGVTLADLHREQQAAREERGEMHRQLDEMAEVVLGKPRRNFDGEIERTGGMREMVEQVNGGGLKVRLPGWVVPVVVALIGLIATIGAAIITTIRSL